MSLHPLPDGVSGAAWTGLAEHHHWSATHLAGLAESVEADWVDEKPGPEWMEARHSHRAYVVGSILSSVVFLEATVNETFSHAADTQWSMPFMEHAPNHREALRKTWSKKTKMLPTLRKYDHALSVGGLQPLLSWGSLREDVRLVLEIRNALVHYEPEWVYTGNEEEPVPSEHQHRLQPAVSGRFSDNSFTLAGDPYWPEKCLGAGCAQWANRATEEFVKEFKRLLTGSA